MTKKIIFKSIDKFGFDTQLKPFPATKAIPDWWKDAKPYIGEEQKLHFLNGQANTSFKKCIPMFDALTSGYIIPMWTDAIVSNKDGYPAIDWRTKNSPFSIHGEMKDMEPPAGYSNFVFKYGTTWMPITPPGYSILVTAPFGYKNLPFHAVPGIIDSDKSKLDFSPPVWLKEGFEGIIEKGTPMVQIIPFKRDDWESKFDFYDNDEFIKNQEKGFASTLINHYKKNIWSKKDYK